jgi:hypothetical protein
MREQFKRKFWKSYGWKKRPPDYRRCAAWVAFNMQRDGKEQCPRPNGHGAEGAYCKRHAKTNT